MEAKRLPNPTQDATLASSLAFAGLPDFGHSFRTCQSGGVGGYGGREGVAAGWADPCWLGYGCLIAG